MHHSVLLTADKVPIVDHAEGVYIYDKSGRQYLDGCGGAMTVSIGHGVPEVIAAMQEQARLVSFVFRSQFTSEAALTLAEELVAIAPGDINHALFVNSGSEATELAMRVALQYWRDQGRPNKTRILGRQISYHGMTMGSLTMSGHTARRADYGNLLQQFAVAPPPYDYRFPPKDEDASNHGAGVWNRILREQDSDTVAAVIVEPIVGAAGGALTPPIGYLTALREICDRHDVLLIADEVITGLGRTGRWFACEHDDIVPDMVACGKGLTSGYTPMAAVLFRERLFRSTQSGRKAAPFGHTFSNNPQSAAICLAVLRYMQDNDILSNVRLRAVQLESGLRTLSARYPWMADVRGRGLLWGFEFVTDPGARTPPDAALEANSRFVTHCFAAGLNVYPAGIAPFNNATILAPPLTIRDVEVDDLLSRLETGLKTFGEEFGFT